MIRAIIDAGPLVAFCDRRDRHHSWVAQTLRGLACPLLTCEAVLAEALYLTRHRADMQDALLEMLEGGMISIPFILEQEVKAIRNLRQKYQSVPMSLADACLVALAEAHDDHRICTFDSDFSIYRKHGRSPIPVISPNQP